MKQSQIYKIFMKNLFIKEGSEILGGFWNSFAKDKYLFMQDNNTTKETGVQP